VTVFVVRLVIRDRYGASIGSTEDEITAKDPPRPRRRRSSSGRRFAVVPVRAARHHGAHVELPHKLRDLKPCPGGVSSSRTTLSLARYVTKRREVVQDEDLQPLQRRVGKLE